MARNYYYLVASLPDLLLDESKGGVSFSETVAELVEHVHPADHGLFRFLRYPFDNTNIINLLDRPDRPFDARGNFSRDDLADALKNPDALPGYAGEFLEARREGKELFPGLGSQDQLAWLFHDAAAAHRSAFIREWFEFECDLRNVMAAVAVREFQEHPLDKVLLRRNDNAEMIARSTAPDFSVSGALPWVERVLAARREGPVESEMQIDRLRWDMLNDLTTFSYFQVESLLAFCLKLEMVERWQLLVPEEGEARLNALVEELLSGFSVAGPVSA